MRRRIFIQGLLSMGLLTTLMLLTTATAYADNCGSLEDCFQTGSSAASVTAGVAVLITIAVLALPSLLGTMQSTPPSTGTDDAPQPLQPPVPPISPSEGQTQPYPQDPASAPPPERQPEPFPSWPPGMPSIPGGPSPAGPSQMPPILGGEVPSVPPGMPSIPGGEVPSAPPQMPPMQGGPSPAGPTGIAPASGQGMPGQQPPQAGPASAQPPVRQPEPLPGRPSEPPQTAPASGGTFPTPQPPQVPSQHQPQDPVVPRPGEPPAPPAEHPVPGAPEHQPQEPVVPHPGEPPAPPAEHPVPTASNQHSAHPQLHPTAPPEQELRPSQQAQVTRPDEQVSAHPQLHPTAPPEQELRPSQQAQVTRPDEQVQVVRPQEPVAVPLNPQGQPPIRSLLYGIHHVTAIAGHPQHNIDFYTRLLGLRLVKQTVAVDNPNTYHLYYGDELGRPGTILSFIVWPGASRGNRGSGQAVAVAFSIPEGTLDYWAQYLTSRGIRLVQSPTRFDEQMFSFYDPDGLQIDLVAHRSAAVHPARSDGPIPSAYAIQGIYGVMILEGKHEHTHAFLTEVLGFRQMQVRGNLIRYEAGNGGPGTFLDVLNIPGTPPCQAALGTIHHLAWRTPENEQQVALQQHLTSVGTNLSQGMDPLYFPAYSFREPGGVLFEVAGLIPGFTVDEPAQQLGTQLTLPPWLAHRQAEIQQTLPPLRL
jgi:glyoxalase family protein